MGMMLGLILVSVYFMLVMFGIHDSYDWACVTFPCETWI